MRLTILDKGHGFRTKALFAFIRVVTRQPTPEIIKLIGYRPAFFGAYMKKVTHEAMRGSSGWSVGDRELMAALVSRVRSFPGRRHAPSVFCWHFKVNDGAHRGHDSAPFRKGVRNG